MLRSDRGRCAAFALTALAGFAVSVAARGEETRHEHAAPERARQAVRWEPGARQSHRPYATRAATVHAVPARVASSHYAGAPTRSGGSSLQGSHGPTAGQVHVAHYGSTVGGTVFERTIRPGLVSRTYVSGGHVLYARFYQSHVWHQYGRAFAYETYVPAVRYPTVYYSWALAAWTHPITYTWGWRAQPWYPTYGVLFAPYAVYSSPDLWMTDYILAQSMQTAYVARSAAPVLEQAPAPTTPVLDSSAATPYSTPGDAPPAAQPNDALATPQSGDTPPAPAALPPAITPAVKAQLDTQIKVQLQDRQAAAATPATLGSDSTPPALKPNHVFFAVVQPLTVASGANRSCSLNPDDYIKRTGGMSQDDWMIPVVVELSAPSDCPAGLHTRIGLNDLNAMENEQEAQVMQAMQAASKSMGPNGPPNTPGVHPNLIVDGSATPDVGALSAIQAAR